MLRRLHPEQPDSFEFTPDNLAWAKAQMTKYPEGRQASAVIPLLWRAQEQEGWISRKAIEEIGRMLDMAYIRVLEVATFYFMFQLQPVGSVAHVQVCGTTSCMICGAEDLIAVCKEKISKRPHQLSEDGKLSWEEVECLGACSNAPMAQIGKDYYEDLTAEGFGKLLDDLAGGKVPTPGSQTGRFASEPAAGLTSLGGDADHETNASVTLAGELQDTVKRIDGSEVPLRTPWRDAEHPGAATPPPVNDDLLGPKGGIDEPTPGPQPAKDAPVSEKGTTKQETDADNKARPDEGEVIDEPDTPAETDRMKPAGDTDESRDPERERTGGGTGPLSGDRDGDDVGDTSGTQARTISEESGDTSGTQARTTSEDGIDPSEIPEGEETRPEALGAPRGGEADDLKRIRGVGPRLEELLNSLGIYHFDQIAGWTPREIAWIDNNLDGFKGRVIRDDWTAQARELSDGGETGT